MIATNATMTANTSKMAFTSSPIQAKSMMSGIITPVATARLTHENRVGRIAVNAIIAKRTQRRRGSTFISR
jgi:hypothetical protein